MAVPYEPAEFDKEAFNCPYCQAYAKQTWGRLYPYYEDKGFPMHVSQCERCGEYSYWFEKSLLIPASANVEMPIQTCRKTVSPTTWKPEASLTCLLKGPQHSSACVSRS